MRDRDFPLRSAILIFFLGIIIVLASAMSAPADKKEDEDVKGKSGNEAVMKIKKAEWEKQRLKVEGKSRKVFFTIIVSDADTGKMLGQTRTDSEGKWKMDIKDLQRPPCRVRAEVDGGSDERDVKGTEKSCNETAGPPPGWGSLPSGDFRVLAFNDLGMHCYDSDFSVFSILPPFNVIHAQVIRQGKEPEVLDDSTVQVYYSAVQDPQGSINTTSEGKTNFWDHVLDLFGLSPSVNEGLTGNRMPGSGNTPQPFDSFDPEENWFTASGIPITAVDDQGRKNHYPMMRIEAYDKGTGDLLAYTDIVLPVSDEMHCGDCHSAGGPAADQAAARKYGITNWSMSADPEVSYRENILILHDAKKGTNLMESKPVLCASCHYSPALDLAGTGPVGPQVGKPLLSEAIHGRHGKTIDGGIPSGNQQAIITENGTTSCYYCHPGSTTKCLRGAMGSAGVNCQDCHGGLLAVAGEYGARTPWLDEPKCQSCHTGDVLENSGSIRMTQAYDPSDPAARSRLASNKRFAENDNTLFRNSLGHGGIACESCHGSTHAIWPAAEPNDNIAPEMIQGHSGTIIECSACHADQLPLTTGGPHGMHNVGDQRWAEEHGDYYEKNPDTCKACHGEDLRGTVLSMTHDDRTLRGDDGHRQIYLPKGTPVGCGLCHENPVTGENETIPQPPTNPPQPGQPGIDGQALYTQYCAGCHGPLTSSSKRGASASKIMAAIQKDKGGMGSLRFLSDTEIQAISDALAF